MGKTTIVIFTSDALSTCNMVITIQSDYQQLWLSLKITAIKPFLLCQTLAGELRRFLWMLNLSDSVLLKNAPFWV